MLTALGPTSTARSLKAETFNGSMGTCPRPTSASSTEASLSFRPVPEPSQIPSIQGPEPLRQIGIA